MKKQLALVLTAGMLSASALLAGCGTNTESKSTAPATTVNTAAASSNALMVYGPGGPFGPMNELAEMFSKEKGIQVKVVAGPEGKWIDQAKQDADIFYGGAEYMLTDFTLRHPELVDDKTRTELYPRAAGILVRKGNPKNIKTLEDLAKPGIKLLDVNGAGQLGLWEDLAGTKGLIAGIQKNIAVTAGNSAEGIDKWKATPELDAWITYESWYYRLKDTMDLVELPKKDKLYRGTPIVIAKTADNKETAQQFISYLKTEKAHAVFKKWGWQ